MPVQLFFDSACLISAGRPFPADGLKAVSAIRLICAGLDMYLICKTCGVKLSAFVRDFLLEIKSTAFRVASSAINAGFTVLTRRALAPYDFIRVCDQIRGQLRSLPEGISLILVITHNINPFFPDIPPGAVSSWFMRGAFPRGGCPR